MENQDYIIPIFIGYDSRERAATNVLIDSIYQNSTTPVSIIPLVKSQLESQNLFFRKKDQNQSTEFSFTRFLVPKLMNYKGWAIFMDCDMLCRTDIARLWALRDDNKALLCVKHNHKPTSNEKFLGERQTKYEKKNWSSLMLFNCAKCKNLTVEYVNKSSGLELHQFKWLNNDSEIGEIKEFGWNYLVDVQELPKNKNQNHKIALLHWTLGGPWFKSTKKLSEFDKYWFNARNDSIKI